MDIDVETWLTGGAILALLAASAFFSGSETALTAASRARMHSLEQEGSRAAKTVNVLLGMRERLIGALLLGNNFVNVLSSALATGFLIDLFGDSGVLFATIGMTALILIFGEVLPKTYAINFPNRTAVFVAPIVSLIVAVLSPINGAVQWMVRQLFRLVGVTTIRVPDAEIADLEIRGAIALHHKEGTVVKGDRDMLGGILDLKELEVADVMVHRLKMETISADQPPEKVVEAALASPHTRLPVWKGDPDNIVGILHVKDLLRELGRRSWDARSVDIETLTTATWFVPDTTPLTKQLGQFLKRNSHLALVVDEYGEVQGLVTLEDILEEIVGQISDEFDRSESLIRPQSDGRVIVDGSVPIRDLNRQMDWNLPDGEATTIAGLVIHEAQTIPESGRAFTFHGYRFEVLRKSRNRITALRIARLPPSAPDSTAA
jgi:Mg2+/Co2+ transporter CorB